MTRIDITAPLHTCVDGIEVGFVFKGDGKWLGNRLPVRDPRKLALIQAAAVEGNLRYRRLEVFQIPA